MIFQAPPIVEVTSDDVVISQSCRVVIPAGTVIEDANNNGVIQITAGNIVVEFAEGSVLRGSSADTRPDEYRGYGIKMEGCDNVTIRNARISGFWCGLHAKKCNDLTLVGIDGSNNRRAYLKSTPVAEDSSDWLYPHANDNNEWLNNYGAAMCVEESDRLTVHDCVVLHGQNGLIIDTVNDAKIYDNNFSFNSGWGIAMWRSCRNVITRNALDFCVRGYSHGVYNRGQDAAGILMFEQNNENIIAENSATHGGDCFFGHAGKDALGNTFEHPAEWYKRRGNNDNLLINNDFSYSPAHGIEMTFSFGNSFIGNRLVENAICGVWGGYSQDTLIAHNEFVGNGEMGYGLERGGVNIEHGRRNRVVHNTFKNNKCGVHFWWDPEGDFLAKTWGAANGSDSVDNLVAANTFIGDDVVFHFQMVPDKQRPDNGKNQVILGPNEIKDAGKELDTDEGSKILRSPNMTVKEITLPEYPVFGESRPIGARKHLRGRQNLIMTEWGPWDHESPLVRVVKSGGDSVVYDLFKMGGEPQVSVEGEQVVGALADESGSWTYTLKATQPGVHPYIIKIQAGDFQKEIAGTLVAVTWDATFFKWTEPVDPRPVSYTHLRAHET